MTALTPQLESRIIDSVRRGTPPRQAIIAAGISAGAFQQWQHIAKGDETWPGDVPIRGETKAVIVGFMIRLAEAQASCMEVLHDALYANATTINPKTGHSDTQALREVLGKHPGSRQDWYENKHQTIDSTVTVKREDQLAESMSDAELDAYEPLALAASN